MSIQVPGYKIGSLIGEGGMASVYLAMQESLNRPVALKILKNFDTKAQITRFFNEGQIIASLNHHNIITIHDLGEINGRCYLAMEYIEGGDLKDHINKGLKPDEATKLVKLIANCLDFVHQKGIIHRDIKPENILFRKDGTLVLTDFGVAKQIQTDTSLTMDGMTIGSPHYISPEQAEHKPLDIKTDLYSLGIIYYEMLTGQKPFNGNSPIEIIIAHLTTEAAPLPSHLERYQKVLDFMIAKDPADRFQSAAELIEFFDKLPTSDTVNSLTDKLGKVISSKNETTKQFLFNPLINQGKRIWFGIALTVILSLISLFFFFQFDQVPAQTLNITNNKNILIKDEAVFSSIDQNIQSLIIQAETILDDPDLSLPKLKKAYDTYNLALKLDSNNSTATKGINHVANLYVQIKNEININLSAAEKALDAYNLTTPENDNAWFYYENARRLHPDNPKAKRGKTKIANAYADLVVSNLDKFEYRKAQVNLDKGLAVHPTSPRLLRLKNQTNAFKDAPKRLFGKLKSVFN